MPVAWGGRGVLPSVPDPRSCIRSLSALRPVCMDVVAQSISGSATEGKSLVQTFCRYIGSIFNDFNNFAHCF